MLRQSIIFLFICTAASGCGSSPTSATAASATVGLAGVTLSSPTVVGVATITGTVTLLGAAPAGGATITLASNNAVVTVPASVVVDSGAISQTFTATVANSPATSVAITATYSGASVAATLTIGRLALKNIMLSAPSVAAGSSVTGTVTLTGPAPPGGALVTIGTSDANASAPASVVIPEGSTSQTFGVATAGTLPGSGAPTTITASYGGSTWSVTLGIAAKLALQTVSLALGVVPGGLDVTGVVTLTAVAPPGGAAIALASSSPDAIVPGSVIVPEGALTQLFTVTTIDMPPSTTATITATFAGASQAAGLAILAYPNVTGVICSPATTTGGTAVSCAGTLASAAPAGGWQLALTSDNGAASVPGSVAVPAGSSTFQFAITTTPVTAATVATIQVVDAPSGLVLFTIARSVT